MRRTHAVLEDSENDDEQHSPGPRLPHIPSDTSNMTLPSGDASGESIDSVRLAPIVVSSPPESAPARNTPSFRFSTRVDSSNRGALIIDVSDEAVSSPDSYEDDTADTRATQDSLPLPTSSLIPRDYACHADRRSRDRGQGTGDVIQLMLRVIENHHL